MLKIIRSLAFARRVLFSPLLIILLSGFTSTPSFASTTSCRDFTNDGFDDFLVRDEHEWTIHPNKLGESNLKTITIEGATKIQDWLFIGTGDFNGDNNCDILIRNANSASLYVYHLTSGQIISRGYPNFNLSPDDKIELLADFNNDGYTDLLTRNRKGGEWSISYTKERQITDRLTINRATDLSWIVLGAGSIDKDNYPDVLLWNRISRKYFSFLSSGLSFDQNRYIYFEKLVASHSAPVTFGNMEPKKPGVLITRSYLTGAWQALSTTEGIPRRSELEKSIQNLAPHSWTHDFLDVGFYNSKDKRNLIFYDNHSGESYGLLAPLSSNKKKINFLKLDNTKNLHRKNPIYSPLLPELNHDIAVLLDKFIRDFDWKLENQDKINFYYEASKLLQASRLYLDSEKYQLSVIDLKKIETYLLTVSEAYFTTCKNYDFNSGPKSSCRSPETTLGYYMWRSPLNEIEPYRFAHAKVEWLSAAGISGAVAALIQKANGSAQVRAENLKAKILKHVWHKWNDEAFISYMNLPDDFLMSNSRVIHYIAWQGMIANLLFDDQIDDQIFERLNLFVKPLGDGRYINFLCSLEDNCRWREYDLIDSKSNDLSHLSYPLAYFFEKEAYEKKIIATLNDVTFANFDKETFPKFDMFFNGYCIENYMNVSSSLYEYCNLYWFEENLTNRSHRQLFGLARYGTKNLALGMKLLEVADTNKDGALTDEDELILDFVVDLLDISIELKNDRL